MSAEMHAAAAGLKILQEKHPRAQTYRVYTDCEAVVRLNHVPLNGTWFRKQGLGEVGTGFKEIAEKVERRGGTVEVVKVDRKVVAGAHLLARRGAKEGK